MQIVHNATYAQVYSLTHNPLLNPHTHTDTHALIHTCMHTYMHVCIHIHTQHTHTRTHTHTQTQRQRTRPRTQTTLKTARPSGGAAMRWHTWKSATITALVQGQRAKHCNSGLCKCLGSTDFNRWDSVVAIMTSQFCYDISNNA